MYNNRLMEMLIHGRAPVRRDDLWACREYIDGLTKAARPSPKPTLSDRHINLPETQPEDRFEDVGLNDGEANANKPKKPGFLSRFGHSSENSRENNSHKDEGSRPSSSHFGSMFSGRKRAQSGQGSELGAMPNGQNHRLGITQSSESNAKSER